MTIKTRLLRSDAFHFHTYVATFRRNLVFHGQDRRDKCVGRHVSVRDTVEQELGRKVNQWKRRNWFLFPPMTRTMLDEVQAFWKLSEPLLIESWKNFYNTRFNNLEEYNLSNTRCECLKTYKICSVYSCVNFLHSPLTSCFTSKVPYLIKFLKDCRQTDRERENYFAITREPCAHFYLVLCLIFVLRLEQAAISPLQKFRSIFSHRFSWEAKYVPTNILHNSLLCSTKIYFLRTQ